MDIYVDAKPVEPLAMPVYPPRALAAHAGDVTVKVDVTVSKEGRVSEMAPDILDFSTISRFHDDFRAAVEAAVSTWRFEPAQIDRLEPKANGQPIIVGSEAQERVFVVSFKFTESVVARPSIKGRQPAGFFK